MRARPSAFTNASRGLSVWAGVWLSTCRRRHWHSSRRQYRLLLRGGQHGGGFLCSDARGVGRDAGGELYDVSTVSAGLAEARGTRGASRGFWRLAATRVYFNDPRKIEIQGTKHPSMTQLQPTPIRRRSPSTQGGGVTCLRPQRDWERPDRAGDGSPSKGNSKGWMNG